MCDARALRSAPIAVVHDLGDRDARHLRQVLREVVGRALVPEGDLPDVFGARLTAFLRQETHHFLAIGFLLIHPPAQGMVGAFTHIGGCT